tara:strand:+ start:6437 stop:7462 length:1026 start_codon:yes stop_codon:yes gene_type:complete
MLNNKIFIIAEAGVNHNGSLELAKKLIDSAVEVNADAIKFQTWKKGELTGKFSTKVDYLKKNTSKKYSRYQISNLYRLTFNDFKKIKSYCKKKGIIFLTTPDGFESLRFVNKVLKLDIIKIGSTELNHLEFIKEAAKTNKKILLSTGMGNINEVKDAINLIKKYSKKKPILLQCTSEYPTIYENINLNVLNTYKKKFKVDIGFSDHSKGFEAAMIAVAYGIKVIEKHFTLDKKMIGPDHKVSLNPKEFKNFINKIRCAEKIVGSSIKVPTNNEIKNINGIRRGIVASKNISKGTMIKKNMLIAKRPFLEIGPNDFNKIIGRILKVHLKKDQPIKWSYLLDN